MLVRAGIVATARTVVPASPAGLTISADSLAAPEFTGGFPGGFGGFNAGLTVRWTNPSQEMFFVVVDTVKVDPEPFILGALGVFSAFNSDSTFFFVYGAP